MEPADGKWFINGTPQWSYFQRLLLSDNRYWNRSECIQHFLLLTLMTLLIYDLQEVKLSIYWAKPTDNISILIIQSDNVKSTGSLICPGNSCGVSRQFAATQGVRIWIVLRRPIPDVKKEGKPTILFGFKFEIWSYNHIVGYMTEYCCNLMQI